MQKTKQSNKDMFYFGLIWTGIFLLVAFLHWKSNNADFSYWLGAGCISLITTIFFIKALTPLFFVWAKIGHVLGYINTRIILSFVFFVMFVPIGLILKLFHKELLHNKIDKDVSSYWDIRDIQPTSMKRLY